MLTLFAMLVLLGCFAYLPSQGTGFGSFLALIITLTVGLWVVVGLVTGIICWLS